MATESSEGNITAIRALVRHGWSTISLSVMAMMTMVSCGQSLKWFCFCHMAVGDEIQSLKRTKLELSTDIDSLTASADQLAEKAESSRSRDMSILVKSNAMHKACKEKTAEMTELDKPVGRRASWAEKLWISFNTGLFWDTIFRPLSGAGPSNFYTQPPKIYFRSDLGRRAALSWALHHISSFTCVTNDFMSTICFYH